MKAQFHSHFLLPADKIYMCGHSLGPPSKSASHQLHEGCNEWERLLVSGWNEADWFHLPKHLGEKIAPLIGALPHEVIVTDNTTTNLLKVLLAGLRLCRGRSVILAEKDNFPADLYMAQTAASFEKFTVQAVAGEDIYHAMNDKVGVLLITHVNYRTSYQHDIVAITAKAKALGIIVIWDFSHSIGILPLDCQRFDIDFAVGCTYKYLNGGPGSPSFLYVNEKYHETLRSPLAGWMGHIAPFAFSSVYEPAKDVTSFLTGTPGILSMKALEGALEIFKHVDLSALREESKALTTLLIEKCAQELPELHCVSPLSAKERGGHVAFLHPHAFAISRAMIEEGIIIDYREPNLLRFGFSPLYIDSQDIRKCVTSLKNILHSNLYKKDCFSQRKEVT